MISFEVTEGYNELRQTIIGGKITGIWKKDSFFKGSSSYPIPNFKYYTSEYCDFEKNIISENSKMIYHLNGYGTKHNEALSSFLGESTERYTFSSYYKLLGDRIVKGTRKDLVKIYGEKNICDVNTLNGFFSREDKNEYLSEDDEIKWIKMNSLENPGENILIPLQMAVSDSGELYADEKKFMPAAVSTGTACHESFIKSMENALIEYMQIDSFNLWWYGGCKGNEIKVDMKSIMSCYFNSPVSMKDFMNKFEVKFTDISFDKDFDIIVCEIFGTAPDVPKYTVGVQGGIGLEKCIYRGFMECLAVLEYNMHVLWIDNEIFKNNKEKTYNLIKNACNLSRYACFMNITLPEFDKLNLSVTRVVLPELLPICLPSYPPFHHSRYKTIGGIRNEYPHPLA